MKTSSIAGQGEVISVVPLPKLLLPEHNLQNSLVVLIDVLRMTSCIVTAMGEGLSAAQLLASVSEVKQKENSYEKSDIILGGEQKRVLIPGFDRDNSPLSYLEGVKGKTALFMTTNGTRAVPWVSESKLLVLGSFLNMDAVIQTIIFHAASVASILLVCSGTESGQTRAEDDELCAACILRGLIGQSSEPARVRLDDTAASVLRTIQNDSWQDICAKFRNLPGAGELKKLGLESDIEFALDLNRYRAVLPVYLRTGHFVPHIVHYDIPVSTYWLQAAVPQKTRTEDTVTVFIVSTGQVGQPLIGKADPTLSDTARAQLNELFDVLEHEDVGLVVSSPLRRAREAADMFARRYQAPIQIHSGFAAVDFGEWTGLTDEEVSRFFPGDRQRWESDPGWCEHDGESLRDVCQRQASAFEEVITSYHALNARSVVIVGHPSTCRSILVSAQGLKQTDWPGLKIPPASVTRLSYMPDGAARDSDASSPPSLQELTTVIYVGLRRDDFQSCFVPRPFARSSL